MTATQICDAVEMMSDSKSRLNKEILLTLMSAKGIKSIAELSRRSGVSRATIFRLKAGGGGLADTTLALARALDTTVETLRAPERPQ